MKLILLLKPRLRLVQRYLTIKKENDFLRAKVDRLEQQVALFKLQELAARKKNPTLQ